MTGDRHRARSADAANAAGTFELLTSPGPAAIAVVRLRGPGAREFLARHVRSSKNATLEPGRVLRGELLDETAAAIDDMLVSVHAPVPPETPRGLELRLHLHGNPVLVRRCMELLTNAGLHEAPPTELSTLWPARDALEAEAWALLPRMLTERGARWLLAQIGRLRAALEQLRAVLQPPGDAALAEVRQGCTVLAERAGIVNWFTTPLRIVLAGPPNAGKSTLANALADRPVSVVSPHPGTTRDWIEEPAEVQGFPVIWIDTAGLRDTADPLEAASAAKSARVIANADVVVLVLDASAQYEPAELGRYAALAPACVALNKIDVVGSAMPGWLAWLTANGPVVRISAQERVGLDELTQTVLTEAARVEAALDYAAPFTDRQSALLREIACADDRACVDDALRRFLQP